jgi:hypothetical protein
MASTSRRCKIRVEIATQPKLGADAHTWKTTVQSTTRSKLDLHPGHGDPFDSLLTQLKRACRITSKQKVGCFTLHYSHLVVSLSCLCRILVISLSPLSHVVPLRVVSCLCRVVVSCRCVFVVSCLCRVVSCRVRSWLVLSCLV